MHWTGVRSPEGWQARMARGIHGLPKVSPGPALPNPSTPCGRATPEMVVRLFRYPKPLGPGGIAARRAESGWGWAENRNHYLTIIPFFARFASRRTAGPFSVGYPGGGRRLQAACPAQRVIIESKATTIVLPPWLHQSVRLQSLWWLFRNVKIFQEEC
jgi:hypothetical protein